MKKKIFFFLIPLTFILLSLDIYFLMKNANKEDTTPIKEVQIEEHIEPIVEPPPPSKEELILANMTDEEKVGQLFIYGIEGNTTLNPQNKQFLIDTKPGGVILFSKNITNEKQLKNLIAEIQSTNSTIPLFISIDQEGGVVSRLKWNETLTKPQRNISSPEEAYQIAKSRGEILRNLGINMNLAPVAEFSNSTTSFMYQRTYKGNVEEVVQKVIYSVKGYEDSKILPVLKHFPGHGTTPMDPHNTLPRINISQEQWDTYILPFSQTIKEESIDAIMVGHILFPNISQEPASISKEIITNRLVNNLGYQGLIISDDMEMRALKNLDTPTNLARQSIESGMDMLMYIQYSNDDRYSQRVAYQSLLDAVKTKEINVDQKVLKILRIKTKYNLIP